VHNVPGTSQRLGDFSATPRMVTISVIAIAIGVVSAWVAKGLLLLISLFTNLFFFQRISTAAVSPADNTLGLWILLVPVVGALIIGLMARYGSDRIRGHGIRVVVQRMAETGLTRFPVVDRDPPNRLVGIISLDDLLKARALNLEAERRRERIMRMDLSFPFKFRRVRETV
jgi:H+/Cl- antiporter ClcA